MNGKIVEQNLSNSYSNLNFREYPTEVDGKLYFTTHQAAEILGTYHEDILEQREAKFQNNIKDPNDQGRYLIPEEDIVNNIGSFKRKDQKYELSNVERIRKAIEDKHLSDDVMEAHKKQQDPEYYRGMKRAYGKALREIQIIYGEEVFFNRLNGKKNS